MNWIKAHNARHSIDGINPSDKGIYWVQIRTELAHLTVRYTTAYWNGYKWYTEPGDAVYYWSVIEQAPEPDGVIYYDALGRIDNVSRMERGVDLEVPPGNG